MITYLKKLREELKKLRKELEKLLNIPKILKANKVYIDELKIANDKIDELQLELTFVKNNEHKRTEEVIKLKKEIENYKLK